MKGCGDQCPAVPRRCVRRGRGSCAHGPLLREHQTYSGGQIRRDCRKPEWFRLRLCRLEHLSGSLAGELCETRAPHPERERARPRLSGSASLCPRGTAEAEVCARGRAGQSLRAESRLDCRAASACALVPGDVRFPLTEGHTLHVMAPSAAVTARLRGFVAARRAGVRALAHTPGRPEQGRGELSVCGPSVGYPSLLVPEFLYGPKSS